MQKDKNMKDFLYFFKQCVSINIFCVCEPLCFLQNLQEPLAERWSRIISEAHDRINLTIRRKGQTCVALSLTGNTNTYTQGGFMHICCRLKRQHKNWMYAVYQPWMISTGGSSSNLQNWVGEKTTNAPAASLQNILVLMQCQYMLNTLKFILVDNIHISACSFRELHLETHNHRVWVIAFPQSLERRDQTLNCQVKSNRLKPEPLYYLSKSTTEMLPFH